LLTVIIINNMTFCTILYAPLPGQKQKMVLFQTHTAILLRNAEKQKNKH